MTKVGLNKARELLLRAIATRGPEFKYRQVELRETLTTLPPGSCTYHPNPDLSHDSPCLIGVVLRLLGLDDTSLWALPPAPLIDLVTRGILKEYSLEFSDKAIKYFGVAQIAQDNGQTWGVALYRAELSLLSE